MKTAILTTDTLHHAYFAREIARVGETICFCETRKAAAPAFETRHPFEDEREDYEAQLWFGGAKPAVSSFVPTRNVESMNDEKALVALEAEKPDFVIVFGTGVIKAPLCERFADRIFNLHGGDPEEYRGLDTHLWAIYHRDFPALVTTLHRLDAGVDTGQIAAQGSLLLSRNMKLHALRAVNSEVCVRLTRDTMKQLAQGQMHSRPQQRAGRYYSAMPAVLKALCVTRFEKHTANLI